jgi:ubiquinone/menaquinone biosynthesis C-methylase UbiE
MTAPRRQRQSVWQKNRQRPESDLAAIRQIDRRRIEYMLTADTLRFEQGNVKMPWIDKSISSDPYRRFAGCYDKLLEPFLKNMRAEADKILLSGAPRRVLDVGCGTGSQLGRYARVGVSAFGLDRSPSMVARAAKKLTGRLALALGDAGRMPFRSRAFDLVLMTMALHEMAPATRSAVLDESRRVLVDEGLLLIMDYAWGPLRSKVGRMLRWLSFIVEYIAGGAHYKNYRQFMTSGGLESLVATHGLKVIRQVDIWHGTISITVMRFLVTRGSVN